MRYFYLFATTFGTLQLIHRWQTNRTADLSLAAALVLITMGVVNLPTTQHQPLWSLFLRYGVGMLMIGIAASQEATWLLWGAGLFILVTAGVDTLSLSWAARSRKE